MSTSRPALYHTGPDGRPEDGASPHLLRIAATDRTLRPLDLQATLDGGQTFRWREVERGVFEGWAGTFPIRLVQDPSLPPGAVESDEKAPAGAIEALARLMDLPRDYRRCDQQLLRRAPELVGPMEVAKGLRIVRLDPWEALLSFILSSHTHIPRIKGMLNRVTVAAGAPGERAGTLPDASRIASLGEEGLRRCGLGYRARYLYRAAAMVEADPGYLDAAGDMPTPRLVAHLQQLPGVGAKVAECVALFGFGRWDAFPVDRWVERAMECLYFEGRPVTPVKLREFAGRRYGPLAGLAQAYLFASMTIPRRRAAALDDAAPTAPSSGLETRILHPVTRVTPARTRRGR